MKMLAIEKKAKIYPLFSGKFEIRSQDKFSRLLRPYWILGSLHGITQHLEELYTRGLKGKTTVFSYILVHHGLFIFGQYLEFKYTSSINYTLLEIALQLSSISIALAALGVLTSSILHQKEFLELRDLIIKVENEAKCLGIWKPYKKIRITSLCILAITMLQWTASLCDFLAECSTGIISGLLLWIIQSYPSKVADIYLLTFCMYIIFTGHLLATVNTNIQHIYQTKMPSMYSIKHERTLEKIIKILTRILELSKLIERIHGLPLVLLVANLQIVLFTNIYFFLEIGFGVKAIMIVPKVALAIILLCSVSQIANSEFAKTKLELLTLPVNDKVSFRRKTSTIIRGVVQQKYELSAYGIFALNSRLIQTTASSVGFYLIMLLQFHLMLMQR